MRRCTIVCRVWLVLTWWLVSSATEAQQPPMERMREPTSYTSVADAFDENDPFDFELGIAFRRSIASATIQREVINMSSQDGRAATRLVDVAEAQTVTNLLELALNAGLYHDLMMTIGLPLVLGQTHELTQPSGCRGALARAEGCVALREPVPGLVPGVMPEDIFVLDGTLASKKRSGVPEVRLGLAWGVTNQYRSPYQPTWVLRAEARIGTGDVMKPCVEGGDCDPGVSRGTTGLALESRWSRRFGHVEPLFGVGYLVEWPTTGAEQYHPGGDLQGFVNAMPPERVDATLGMSVIAWEDRSRFQRFEVDTRGSVAYVSGGREYTPLFDALGSSAHPYLTAPQYDRLAAGATLVPFTGLTHVQAHGLFGLRSALVMQAARYVRFELSFATRYQSAHLLTGAAPCNAGVDPGGDARLQGSCAVGTLNPLHRPVIDLPGNRFRSDGELTLDLGLSALGQF